VRGLAKPSYHQGFAPRDGRPKFGGHRSGLLALWGQLLGNTGSTIRDFSGHCRHQTISALGSAGACWLSTKHGKAVRYGNGAYSSASVDGTWLSQMSLLVALRCRGAQSTKGLFSWHHSSPGSPFVLLQRYSPTYYRWYCDLGYRHLGSLGENQWAVLALTGDNNALDWRFYHDGIRVGNYQGDFTRVNYAQTVYLAYGYNGYADVDIPFAALWSRVLPAKAIRALSDDLHLMCRLSSRRIAYVPAPPTGGPYLAVCGQLVHTGAIAGQPSRVGPAAGQSFNTGQTAGQIDGRCG
jgi:hypothetical protein